MAEPKTRPTKASVEKFLKAVPDEKKRKDSFMIMEMMKKVTGEEAIMWGDAIVGFGNYALPYAGGKTLDWPVAAFSPRKQSMTLYLLPSDTLYEPLRKKLGKHKMGKSCLYFNKLEDVDITVLEKIVDTSVKAVKKLYK